MSCIRNYQLAILAVLICPAAVTQAETTAVVPTAIAPTTPTIWRFMGIPQGLQKIRDVTTNRRGNHPGLERKPPLKAIADPANLASENPAIKAAAEIKQAEDMKKQKIKAIKYLASIGCGCYDKDGKITEAILASTDDCTPEVRLAAVEAIGEASSNGCCGKCGSTSCCNEKITKRLSEMAYERDDDGCPIEPSAEIRCVAKQVLCKCCPGGPPTGPIEEDYEVEVGVIPAPTVAEEEEPIIQGESEDDDAVRGESTDEDASEAVEDASEAVEEASEAVGSLQEATTDEAIKLLGNDVTDPSVDQDPVHVELRQSYDAKQADEYSAMLLRHAILSAPVKTKVGEVKMIGGMPVQPVSIAAVGVENMAVQKVTFKKPVELIHDNTTPLLPRPILDPMLSSSDASSANALVEEN
ncbi:hypothetical protein Q31b_49050 [Novipirellula aureliae]|uniref:HEAT repeat protein n=1 Tax=Novipirellula aureliae TaxID=2527966 RepID=A0A5C6DKL4_9BACT|nr:hypothetical protein [Novipirellula aureliae]TWU36624.1 hypothetical protein Q31b_49050 [Novipirellula aureliae]